MKHLIPVGSAIKLVSVETVASDFDLTVRQARSLLRRLGVKVLNLPDCSSSVGAACSASGGDASCPSPAPSSGSVSGPASPSSGSAGSSGEEGASSLENPRSYVSLFHLSEALFSVFEPSGLGPDSMSLRHLWAGLTYSSITRESLIHTLRRYLASSHQDPAKDKRLIASLKTQRRGRPRKSLIHPSPAPSPRQERAPVPASPASPASK